MASFEINEYDSLVEKLFARHPSFGTNGSSAFKPGLERIREMCRRLGSPDRRLRCIHVAGTNGKGSTCNMISAHFASKGLKVGLYTSPHILDFRERVRTVTADGVQLVPREYVWDFLISHQSDIEELDLSLFEITTALAFAWFADRNVDIAVIETGLGGRLDATNIITPILSIITNIGLDHTDLLGNTLALIAGEKAGIIKPGVPVVVGESDPETTPVFKEAAARNGSDLVFADAGDAEDAASADAGDAGEGANAADGVNAGEGASAQEDLATEQVPPGFDLQGIYQARNIRTVCCALRRIGEEPRMEALASAAHICGFHGRWEKISDNPLTICDIGHNAHGLRHNFAQLEAMLDRGEATHLLMVYGSVADKDVDAVLRLMPQRAYVFFAAAPSPRAMAADEIFRRSQALPLHPQGCVCPDVAQALGKALAMCGEIIDAAAKAGTLARPMVYIGGSTYIVSEALKTAVPMRTIVEPHETAIFQSPDIPIESSSRQG